MYEAVLQEERIGTDWRSRILLHHISECNNSNLSTVMHALIMNFLKEKCLDMNAHPRNGMLSRDATLHFTPLSCTVHRQTPVTLIRHTHVFPGQAIAKATPDPRAFANNVHAWGASQVRPAHFSHRNHENYQKIWCVCVGVGVCV